MSLVELLQAWRQDAWLNSHVAAWRTLPARPARSVDFPSDLHETLSAVLRRRAITQLYTHQASAWRAARAGKHFVVVTATASGKTLCYNLPVLDRWLREPHARALYLFPTKALAHDQADELQGLLAEMREMPRDTAGVVATYDGDTPNERRAGIRAQARIVLTNPDMLHTGILPHHTLWASFFQNLRFIVIDELHTWRGVLGSHIANVLRRLRRIARFYGAAPQFIMTSATIANPVELASRLSEEDVSLIDDDGAPRGAKHFVIYNPPVVNAELGLRKSALLEAVRLSEQLLACDAQTIMFARSRQSVELMLNYLRQSVSSEQSSVNSEQSSVNTANNAELSMNGEQSSVSGHQLPMTHYQLPALRAYRGGYLPSVRREIEQGLREGSVRGVVATNALELGIDIGRMSASVMVGYPGTVAATWQQAGRAGRSIETSLALLVVSASPLDQYLARHSAWFFERSPEHGLINPDNLVILLQHLRCAAFELPFRKGEMFGRIEGARVKEFLDFLSAEGVLHESNEKYFWMSEKYPADTVSLRSASPQQVVVLVNAEASDAQRPMSKVRSPTSNVRGPTSNVQRPMSNVQPPMSNFQPPTSNFQSLGTVDLHSAFWMLHPQAIYLHEAQTYFVDELDLTQQVARVRPVNVNYYTDAVQEVTIALSELFAEAEAHGGRKAHGEVTVTAQVTGFRKRKWFTHENLGMGVVDLPPTELLTTGYWVSLPEETVERLRATGLWRNDANDYGPDWQRMRAQSRERDGYRCQQCGLAEDGRQHHVHHKIPFKKFAHAQAANQLSNLITLCASCHQRVETAVRVRSGLAGVSHVLGHMAPLLLMCDRRDLGVHSDPKSPLTAGNPTIVIYDQAPAGIGLSERLYEWHDALWRRAQELVATCACADGCPSCVGPAGENGEGGKAEALAILEALSVPLSSMRVDEHE